MLLVIPGNHHIRLLYSIQVDETVSVRKITIINIVPVHRSNIIGDMQVTNTKPLYATAN